MAGRGTARAPLSRHAVLSAAVDLADDQGVAGLSMRTLAEALGVVPMALYKHVSSKEDLLDGMVDSIVAEIDPPLEGQGWKMTVRSRVTSWPRSGSSPRRCPPRRRPGSSTAASTPTTARSR